MRYDDPNAPISATVAIVSAVLVLVSVVLLEALYYKMQDREFQTKVVAPKDQALVSLQTEQSELLARYGWVNKDDGIARIPIEHAMELTVSETPGLE